MPRDPGGNYTLPISNPVVSGQIIDVNWANPTLVDIANQLNNVYTRDGLLGPLGPFAVIDGSVSSPSLTFSSEPALGFYRESTGVLALAAGGNTVVRFVPSGVSVTGGVNVNGAISKNGTPIAEVPTGTILDFAGSTAPLGYLVCDGGPVSRTTYAALFAVIGTIWGAGNGSTTFNVPDLRRRVGMGAGGVQLAGPGISLGNAGGQELSTIDTNNMPSHTHGINDGTHAHYVNDPGHTHGVSDPTHAHTVYDPGHSHQIIHDPNSDTAGNGISGSGRPNGGTWQTEAYGTNIGIYGAATGIALAGALTGIWLSGNGANISVQAAGSGTTFSNVPPSVVVNKLIKT